MLRSLPRQILIILAVGLATAAVHRSRIEDRPQLTFARPTDRPVTADERSTDEATTGTEVSASGSPSIDDPFDERYADIESGALVELLTVEQAYRRHQSGEAQFIDARVKADYERGHVPGALHLPFSDFPTGEPEALQAFLPELLTIVYCEGGNCDSSKLVAEQLYLYGYDRLAIIEEGFPAWEMAGYPVETE